LELEFWNPRKIGMTRLCSGDHNAWNTRHSDRYGGAVITGPPSRPHLRARFEERRQQVLDEAAAVFAERGYHDTSIRDLLDATGFTIGRMYHYIGTKEDLLFMIFERYADELLERLHVAAGTDAPSANRLSAVIEVWLEHALARRDHRTVVQQEWPVLERGRYRYEVRARARAYRELLSELVGGVAADRELRLGDRALTAAVVEGLVDSAVRLEADGGIADAGELARRFADLLLARSTR
jgi:TetR/AcrR family transcriptional regulator, cholesterol catabolism regulator